MQVLVHDPVTMPTRGRGTSQKSSWIRQGPAASALNTKQTNFRWMATEAPRLLLAQHNLMQTGTRQQFIARLEAHHNNPPSGLATVADTSSTANTLYHKNSQPTLFCR